MANNCTLTWDQIQVLLKEAYVEGGVDMANDLTFNKMATLKQIQSTSNKSVAEENWKNSDSKNKCDLFQKEEEVALSAEPTKVAG